MLQYMLSLLLTIALDPWVLAAMLSFAGYGYWLFARADEVINRAMQDEDTRDGLLAKKHLRALRRGMMIMEVARNPLLIKEGGARAARPTYAALSERFGLRRPPPLWH